MKFTTRLAGAALLVATFISTPHHMSLIESTHASYSESKSSFSAIQLPAEAYNKVLGVRVSDVIKHLPSFLPGLSYINQQLNSDKNRYFGDKGNVDELLNLYFSDLPKANGDKVRLNLTALIKYGENSIAFKEVIVEYSSSSVGSFSVLPVKFTNLSETKLVFDVGLKARKVVITDEKSNIKMIFPLGVGAFDEAVLNEEISLLTPRFKDGYLDKTKAIRNREKPRYFAGLPFVRILKGTDRNEDHTGIGFHAQPFPDKNKFIRAFDSHGCMRMQTPDLWSVYFLVAAGPTTQLPITVNYSAENTEEHPFPKQEKPYKRVANTGTKENPVFKLDRDNLVQVYNNWDENAPVENLVDLAEDHYHQIFNYSTAELVEDKWENIRERCNAKSYGNPNFTVNWSDYEPNYDSNDSSWTRKIKLRRAKKKYEKALKNIEQEKTNVYESCVDKHKRDVSISDRLYKWWIHGR